MKSYYIFSIIILTIIAVLIYTHKNHESFALDILNSKCSDYIENTFGVKWNEYTPDQQSVIGDMLRATISTDTLDGQRSDDIGGCIFPARTLPQYSIGDTNGDDACNFKDGKGNDIMPRGTKLIPVGLNTANSSVDQDGCMLRFTNDLAPGKGGNFDQIIKKAYVNKEYPTAKQIEDAQNRIEILKRETANIISDTKMKTDFLTSYTSKNNTLQTNITAMNANLDRNNQQITANNKQIAELNQSINQNQQDRINMLQSAQVRLVKETKFTNKPIIQKRMSDGKWYTLIMKYTYGMSKKTNFNNDPYLLYQNAYGANINIDTVTNNSPDAFINDSMLQYRNNSVLDALMNIRDGSIPGDSRVIIEIYNDTSIERMAAIEFMHKKGNDYVNWWNANNLQTSDGRSETTITNLINDAKNCNFFGGFWGDDYHQRRWFINRGYNGCSNDPGYIGIPYRGDMSWCWDTMYRGKILIAKENYFNFGGNGMDANQISRYHLGTKMLMWMRKDQNDPYQKLSNLGSVQLLEQINYAIPMKKTTETNIEIVGSPITLKNADMVLVPGKNIPINNGDYTWTFWLRTDGPHHDWRSIFHWGDRNEHRSPACWVFHNDTGIHFRQSTSADLNSGFHSVPGPDWGTWGFLTFTLENTTLTSYLNGKETGKMNLDSTPIFFRDEYLHVGDPWYDNFDGKVNVAYLNMFPYVLTQQEMQNIMNSTANKLPMLEPGPTIEIAGNNGTVSCTRYCNGNWGKSLLASKASKYSGAYSAQFSASSKGICPCILSNKVTWNQNTKPNISMADLGITS